MKISFNVNMNTINLDYIGAVHFEKERFEYRKHSIEHPQKLLNELNDILEDSSRTVKDMRAAMRRHYRFGDKKWNYCLPEEMSDSYVSLAVIPDLPELYQEITKGKSDVAARVHFEFEYLREHDIIDAEIMNKAVQESVDQYMANRERLAKEEYLDGAHKYIHAAAYHKTKAFLNNDNTIVILSSSQIGYNVEKFHLDDNLTFSLTTNLGYGESSYISMNAWYKGRLILFCSDFLSEFTHDRKPSMYETFKDKPTHEAFEEAMQKICTIGNLYLSDKVEFEKVYFCDEIIAMRDILDKIIRQPAVELERSVMMYNILQRDSKHECGLLMKDFLIFPHLFTLFYKYWAIVQAGYFIMQMKGQNTINEEIRQVYADTLTFIEISTHNAIPEIYSEVEQMKPILIRHEYAKKQKELLFKKPKKYADHQDSELDIQLSKEMYPRFEALEKALRIIWSETGMAKLLYDNKWR